MGLYDQLASALRTDLRIKVDQLAQALEELARRDVPNVTGQLASSIVSTSFETFNMHVIRVAATAPYARWVNEGTGVYAAGNRIYPVSAPALVFYWEKAGGVVAFASVRGQPGQHYWDGQDGLRWNDRLIEAERIVF